MKMMSIRLLGDYVVLDITDIRLYTMMREQN